VELLTLKECQVQTDTVMRETLIAVLKRHLTPNRLRLILRLAHRLSTEFYESSADITPPGRKVIANGAPSAVSVKVSPNSSSFPLTKSVSLIHEFLDLHLQRGIKFADAHGDRGFACSERGVLLRARV